MKRAVDIVLGTILAVLALPLIVVLAVTVMVALRTWRPFFVQRRIGYRGRPFRLLKLRTLPVSAPRYADKYALSELDVPRVCRALRYLHLDELPQLILVPFGIMSLVGPRPEMEALTLRFDPAFVERRTSVRPGCTGLWQISVDSWRLMGETPEYDLLYVDNASAALDVWILWRTAGSLLRQGKGIDLASVPRRFIGGSGNAHEAITLGRALGPSDIARHPS